MRMTLKLGKMNFQDAALHRGLLAAKHKVRHLLRFPEPELGVTVELEYVGFWARSVAAIMDLILLLAIAVPIFWLLYERSALVLSSSSTIMAQVMILGLLPPIAITFFWIRHYATPGKMSISAIIIDEKTAGPPSIWQLIGRYCAYFLSALPLGLGFIWIGFDHKKQGWHDRMAGTLVVRARKESEAIA